MNRRLARGAGAGVLALAFGAAGSTLSAPIGAADVTPNIVRGGSLLLDLGQGAAGATLGFDHLEPGQQRSVHLWVASNDLLSDVPAELAMTVDAVHDSAAPCATSLGKAQGEIDSRIGGCTIVDGVAAGTPDQGNLSRVLEFDVRYARKIDDRCPTGDGSPLVAPSAAGNLRSVEGTTTLLTEPGGTVPLRLAPGQAVCFSVSVRWPDAGSAQGSPQHPVDNAVQGDSLTLGVRFDLIQAVG